MPGVPHNLMMYASIMIRWSWYKISNVPVVIVQRDPVKVLYNYGDASVVARTRTMSSILCNKSSYSNVSNASQRRFVRAHQPVWFDDDYAAEPD